MDQDWGVELFKMLAALNSQVTQSLHIIRAKMKNDHLPMDSRFKQTFLETINQRIEECYDQFEAITNWNEENQHHVSVEPVTGSANNTPMVDLGDEKDVIVLDLISNASAVSEVTNQIETDSQMEGVLDLEENQTIPDSSDTRQATDEQIEKVPDATDTAAKAKKVRKRKKIGNDTKNTIMKRLSGNAINQLNCKDCDYSTNTKADLIRHMRTHTLQKPFECLRCDKQFLHQANLKEHMKFHANDFEFQCDRCFDGFTHVEQKHEHEEQCTMSKYECSICKDYATLFVGHMRFHMLQHTL